MGTSSIIRDPTMIVIILIALRITDVWVIIFAAKRIAITDEIKTTSERLKLLCKNPGK